MYIVVIEATKHYTVYHIDNWNPEGSGITLGMFRDMPHALAAASLYANILHGDFKDASVLPGYKECTREWVDIRV